MICDLSTIGYVGSAKRYFTTIFEMSQKSQGIKAYRAACLFESQDSLEQNLLCNDVSKTKEDKICCGDCNDRDILWNECNQYFGCK